MVGKPQNVPGDVLGRRLLRRGSETVSEERKGKVMPGGGWRKSHLPVLWAGGPSPSHTRVRVFYWSLIASQCCLSLRSSGAWIGGVYAGLPPWASPLPPPTAEGLSELLAATPWSPTATRRRPTLSICVSVPALEIEASVPFLQIPHTCVNNFFCFFFFHFLSKLLHSGWHALCLFSSRQMTQFQKLEWECGEKGALLHSWWECKLMTNSMEVP